MNRSDLIEIEQHLGTLRVEWLAAWATEDKQRFLQLFDRLEQALTLAELQGQAAASGYFLDPFETIEDEQELRSAICLETIAKMVGYQMLKLWLGEDQMDR